jgi:hypothetical protein
VKRRDGWRTTTRYVDPFSWFFCEVCFFHRVR